MQEIGNVSLFYIRRSTNHIAYLIAKVVDFQKLHEVRESIPTHFLCNAFF